MKDAPSSEKPERKRPVWNTSERGAAAPIRTGWPTNVNGWGLLSVPRPHHGAFSPVPWRGFSFWNRNCPAAEDPPSFRTEWSPHPPAPNR
jgi:hypothetical protein